ncbi:IS607 family transposase [Glycomyces xiaoerkulensis]|uniref:IS607 family transposase n=1 Tax=Glycomyces xiaoerkulensis TaxID=2038139 RepID=UPI0013000661|nr:IS607 family transposase [Glycomyces xiaoerkulensis]
MVTYEHETPLRLLQDDPKLATELYCDLLGQRLPDYTEIHPGSSPGQQEDLASQVAAKESFCLWQGIAVDQWVSEIGDGMDLRRRKLLELKNRIEDGLIGHVLMAHQDRIARFGYDYLEHIAAQHCCRITVVNDESLSPHQELVEDLLAIVHTFSCRLHRLRGYEQTLNDELSGGQR